MTNEIPNLWPTNFITVDVLTPAAILRLQVPPLRQSTQGLLDAEVRSDSNDTEVELHLDVIAPALRKYRHRLITVLHAKDLVYPARVQLSNSQYVWVNSQNEFIQQVRQLLGSPQTIALLQSLIARSNEEKQAEEKVEPNGVS